MNWHYFGLLFITSTVGSGWITWFLIKIFKSKRVLDIPNARSNHQNPIPRGAGLATLIIFVVGYPFFSYVAFNEIYNSFILAGAALIIGAVGFIDDLKPLSIKIRLAAHLLAASLVVFLLLQEVNLLLPSFIPNLIEKILISLTLAYFISIYNFMDGIDGITGSNNIMMMIGVLLLVITKTEQWSLGYISALIIGSSIGFLIFNWHPAKIFYGDVGSTLSGFIIGYCLLKLAYKGGVINSLILPSYYLCDATFTLISRMVKREKFWQPHSKHVYQRLVRSGLSHSHVTLMVTLYSSIAIITALCL
ncbi:MraY family glycosyltransferase [Rickettsiales endosymbiont of Stachyamoeba lipophora]|uniref:MraY family glycosyltransferase n=1 Tax=Rickettsiales endosymbiont of Stachyamoeba lipophora TaxID=2486578 RepID=UPI000F645716|nr:glycosyltransferase family 4 protein [Rickettsiales endosymbiont of Stachyamoeba lipophora]AZL16021.1 glycosyltransferase family 4 protein [Rickettsiales endosymbiont of Stachyamoeba lipophora]